MGKDYCSRHKRRRVPVEISKEVLNIIREKSAGTVASSSSSSALVSVNQPPSKLHRQVEPKIPKPVRACDEELDNNEHDLSALIVTGEDSEEDSEKNFSSTVNISDSSDGECEIVSRTPQLSEKLRSWSLENNVTHTSLDQLLKILSPHHSSLPLCARTLLGTPRTFEITTVSGGSYIHIGLRHHLEKFVRVPLTDRTKVWEVQLNFNIDGLPVHNNSNNNSLWPILGMIRNQPNSKPFCIGVYLGATKPKCIREYLQPFVTELMELSDHPFPVGEFHCKVNVSKCLFCCDTPARAFLKGIMGHNAKHGCDKCEVKGTWLSLYRKTVFLSCNSRLRTNESFRRRLQEDHHQPNMQDCVTLMEELDLDMIRQFPCDYMHLICLGMTRKLCALLKSGRKSIRVGSHVLQKISSVLRESSKFIPKEFSRKPRPIECSDKWKATECRLFLLYLAPVVLRDILQEALYKHILLLSCAMLLVASPNRNHDDVAEEYFKIFVEHFPRLYGEENVTYTTHNILHIMNDVKEHGSVDNFSCFPFENHLASIKRLIRAPNHTLQQVYARLNELDQLNDSQNNKENELEFKLGREHSDGPVIAVGGDVLTQHYSLKLKTFTVQLNDSDRYICTGEDFFVVKNIIRSTRGVQFVAAKLIKCGDYFTYPCKSSDLGICVVKENSKSLVLLDPRDATKCMKLCLNSEQICIKLRHFC